MLDAVADHHQVEVLARRAPPPLGDALHHQRIVALGQPEGLHVAGLHLDTGALAIRRVAGQQVAVFARAGAHVQRAPWRDPADELRDDRVEHGE